MKALRFVLLAIACAMVFGLGWRLLHPGWSPRTVEASAPPVPAVPPKPASPSDARALVLSRLADAPAYGPFFEQLRAVFPTDYLSLVDQASQTVAAGGRVPNPDRLVADAMRHLRQTRGILAAQAETGPLTAIFQAQALVLDLLAEDSARLCADFLYGGSSPEFMAFAAKHRDVMARLALANLDAVSNGKAKHIERPSPEPEDFDDLAADFKAKGFSDNETAAVLDGKTFDPPLPDARLCEAGRFYLHALETMPEEARLRIYALSAALLARS